MQTFLPYTSFIKSLACLDYRRLGKQRVDAKQIIQALTGEKKGWRNHPAVKMWEGHTQTLQLYHNYAIDEWVRRGYNNTMPKYDLTNVIFTIPLWLGHVGFHNAHKSNLLRKDPFFYSQYNWNVPNNLPYIWPTP